MKKIILILTCFLTLNYTKCQTLSGNCSDNLSGTISYNPVTDGYINSSFFLPNFSGSKVASGDYKIFPAIGNNCSTLKKVVIVVEGFDIDNLPFMLLNKTNNYKQLNKKLKT